MQTLNHPRVVVLGGGYAGMLAAQRIAGRVRRARVTLVSASPNFVERIRLHQVAAGQQATVRPIAGFLRGTGAAFRAATVLALDPDRRRLEVESTGGREAIGYDYLVYALGSRTDRESVPGAVNHTWTLDGPEGNLPAAVSALAARGGHLVVAGGGLTGIEAATEIAEAHPDLGITLVTRDPLGGNLSARGQDYLHAAFRHRNIAVREGVTIERVEAGRLETATGETIPFDGCLWAASFRAPDLAGAAGLAVDERGRLVVDATLRSASHPEIFAAGDAAAVAPHGETLRMGCATAMPLGCRAGDNVAALLQGAALRPLGFGYFTRNISLGRRDGLIQFVDARDRPKDRLWTGRPAAWYKEAINRTTVWVLAAERRWPGFYRWPSGPGEAPAFRPAPGRSRDVAATGRP